MYPNEFTPGRPIAKDRQVAEILTPGFIRLFTDANSPQENR
jgi:hypothetical protein